MLTHHLSRYGSALGIDFGEAIGSRSGWRPKASFRVASLEDLGDERFDLITVLDVMEHIPQAERPAFTLHKRATDAGHLQIIYEAVEIANVVGEAAGAGLQLLRYEAYDVFAAPSTS